jgi:hypothetical protein
MGRSENHVNANKPESPREVADFREKRTGEHGATCRFSGEGRASNELRRLPLTGSRWSGYRTKEGIFVKGEPNHKG